MEGDSRCRAIALLVLASSLGQSVAQAQRATVVSTITGAVRGSDRAPMPIARVTLRTAAFKLVTPTQPDSAGRFALAYGGTGSVYVGFGGVRHDRYEKEIYLDGPQTISLDARIAALVYTDPVTAVKAIGDFNNFKWSTARPLTKNADGTWTLDGATTADTVAYQLIGVGERGAMPGTDAVRYAVRGPDNYATVNPVHRLKDNPDLIPQFVAVTDAVLNA